MIGRRDTLPAARWREKRSPPMPLIEGEGFLYAPPAERGAPATLAWIFDDDPEAALERACARAMADGATSLYLGGPPGNYLVSGVDEGLIPWFEARGFAISSRHVDLSVDPRGLDPDPRVSRGSDRDEALRFVLQEFGPSWRAEATRAASHDALWVTRDARGLTGFVAAQGNNADAGGFGPVGVLARARGEGLGEALTRTALHALAQRGFDEVTIPWVAPERTRFYSRVTPPLRTTRRARMRRRFDAHAA